MSITLHKTDLPADVTFKDVVAVDMEFMGLNPRRDRLCLVQLSQGDGTTHLVQLDKKNPKAPNLQKLLEDPKIVKIFHFGRKDMEVTLAQLGILIQPVFCTKIASRIARTFTPHHSLRNLCKDLMGVDLSKQQQSSDWGAAELTENQLKYAASDVLYLHEIREKLIVMLEREGRMELAQACLDFLPHRVKLDVAGWPDDDIFAY